MSTTVQVVHGVPRRVTSDGFYIVRTAERGYVTLCCCKVGIVGELGPILPVEPWMERATRARLLRTARRIMAEVRE